MKQREQEKVNLAHVIELKTSFGELRGKGAMAGRTTLLDSAKLNVKDRRVVSTKRSVPHAPFLMSQDEVGEDGEIGIALFKRPR